MGKERGTQYSGGCKPGALCIGVALNWLNTGGGCSKRKARNVRNRRTQGDTQLAGHRALQLHGYRATNASLELFTRIGSQLAEGSEYATWVRDSECGAEPRDTERRST